MTDRLSNIRRVPATRAIGLALLLATGMTGTAVAQEPERYPDIHLVYRDLPIETIAGQRALVDRIQTTATMHCQRYGPLIVPYERLNQPQYCINAVRGEIVQALPRPIRNAYEAGRRANAQSGARPRGAE